MKFTPAFLFPSGSDLCMTLYEYAILHPFAVRVFDHALHCFFGSFSSDYRLL